MSLKTLDNALEILKFFTDETPAWGVRELAKELDVSHSIIHRVLATYEKHGFLAQNQVTKKYVLGIKFWEYGQLVQKRLKLVDAIRPIMHRLCEDTGESVILTILEGIEAVDIEIVESPQKVKYELTVGNRAPLYVGASSKVLMAYLPEEKRAAVIEQGLSPYTANTIVDPEKLIEDLDNIKQQGWCYSRGEYFEDTFGISIPLFNKNREIVASLSIAGPSYRMPEVKVQDALHLLEKRGKEIQDCLSQIEVHPLFQ
ncbi:IclR family transcriptional regulator [Brevibacillus borstelensis]|uniref:IclR family transcriptional regulator n=1 Tax=Brevibacillus borstelensis TaxID=45462 RepID=UPI0030C247A5